MKNIIYLLLSTLSFAFLNAQEQFPCHSDEMHYQLVQANPSLLQHFELKRQELETFTKNFEEFQAKSGPYIIPIVFHVIHMNGDENVSDDQLFDAVKNLNEQYNKRNADTSLTIAAFKGIAANVQVEFRLAKLDPDGNCTNGITRHYSPTSAIGDHTVKSVVHWPREKYLNVYVCKSATSGMAGHSLMPPVADTLPDWDGIVMSHTYVGTIGTSEWSHRTVLSHEVGHYKRKHIIINLFAAILTTGFTLWLLSLFIGNPLLSQALHVSQPSFHIGLVAFGVLYSPISGITGLVMNYLSRKFEYQADNYAKNTYAGPPLISGLKKLSKNSLSNLTPHPLYVFAHYSHPTLLQRFRNLEK